MYKLRKLKITELEKLLKERELATDYRVKEDLVKRLYEYNESVRKSEVEKEVGKTTKNSVEFGEESIREFTYSIVTEITGELSEQNFELVYENSEDTTDSSRELSLINNTCDRSLLQFDTEEIKNSEMSEEKNTFSFRDIEESLEKFDGESGKDVVTWLKEFEEISVMCNWSVMQKYLYARRLLKGAAKLAVEADTGEKSWEKLKEILKQEFVATKSSISLHRILENRKKLTSESYLEYIYAVKQIASKGNIDEESIVAYVIDGISDHPTNKALLYEAKTIGSLKEKLKAYESMKNQKIKSNDKFSVSANSLRKPKQDKVRCLTCGAYSHVSSSCPHKAKGMRCFNCNEFGHISLKCTQPRKVRDSGSKMEFEHKQIHLVSSSVSTLKVSIGKHEYTALVDTGSDVTLIKRRVYSELSLPANCESQGIALTGFGRNVNKTICSIPFSLIIDGDRYEIQGHVVQDEWLNTDVLIGKDLLKDATLIMENGKPIIKKSTTAKQENEIETKIFLLQMDVLELIKEEELESIKEIPDEKLREKEEYEEKERREREEKERKERELQLQLEQERKEREERDRREREEQERREREEKDRREKEETERRERDEREERERRECEEGEHREREERLDREDNERKQREHEEREKREMEPERTRHSRDRDRDQKDDRDRTLRDQESHTKDKQRQKEFNDQLRFDDKDENISEIVKHKWKEKIMRGPENLRLAEVIEEAFIGEFEEKRNEIRRSAKEAIAKIQEENRRYALRKRKKAQQYHVRDLVAVKKTQFCPGAKLSTKFMGPYEVIKEKGNDRYELKKVGFREGPNLTTSSADHMKPWISDQESEDSSGSNE